MRGLLDSALARRIATWIAWVFGVSVGLGAIMQGFGAQNMVSPLWKTIWFYGCVFGLPLSLLAVIGLGGRQDVAAAVAETEKVARERDAAKADAESSKVAAEAARVAQAKLQDDLNASKHEVDTCEDRLEEALHENQSLKSANDGLQKQIAAAKDGRPKTAADELLREQLRRAAALLTGALHARWFSNGKALDSRYRVSLFMRETEVTADAGEVAWVCVARTITAPERAATWSEVHEAEGRAKSGLVNFVVTTHQNAAVRGVPLAKRDDPKEQQRYLSDSCLTNELHAKRSWKWASLQVKFARGRDGKILCAIVVEREDGETIKLARDVEIVENFHVGDKAYPVRHDACEWEHQLAANVWAAVRDHS